MLQKFCFSLSKSINFLVQRLLEQFESLQTSLDVAVLPEPILAGADAVQHLLDFGRCVTFRVQCLKTQFCKCVVELARLVSTLLMSLPLNFLADLRELDLLPEKIRITVLYVFEKIAHLRHVRAVELASAYHNCVPRSFVASRAAASY